MTPEEAKAKLADKFPVLGHFRRRAAIRALSSREEPSGVCILAEAIDDQSHPDKARIVDVLKSLSAERDRDRIVMLWSHWSRKPSPSLARILLDLDWHKGRPTVAAELAAAVAVAPGMHSDPVVAQAASMFLSSAHIFPPADEANKNGVRTLFSTLRNGKGNLSDSVASALSSLSSDLDAQLLREMWLDWCQQREPSLAVARVLAKLGWPAQLPLEWPIARAVLELATERSEAAVMQAVHALAKAMPIEWPAATEPGATIDPRDQLFHAWMRCGSPLLETLISERALRPATPALAAMHALAAGRLDAYDALGDHDSTLLTQAYALAPEAVRLRMDKTAGVLAQRAVAARAQVFRPPSHLADLYRRNPYAVLGLRPSETTTRVLMRRRDDLITLLAVGSSFAGLPGYLAVDLGASAGFTGDEVRAAVSRLQSEPDRCRQALLWFRLDGESDEMRAALANGRLDEAEHLWRERTAREAGPPAEQALFNLAVLQHGRALAAAPSIAAAELEAYAAGWRSALQRWREVLLLPQTGAYIAKLCAGMTDPRMDQAFADGLQAELPGTILRVNLELASAAAAVGLSRLAGLHIQIVEDSGFPQEHVTRALEAFFTPLLTPIRRALQPLTSGSVKLTEDVDFGTMCDEYLHASSRLAALNAKPRMVSLVEEARDAGRSKLLQETNALYANLKDQYEEFLDAMQGEVDSWNELMDERNRGHARTAQLLEVRQRVAVEGMEELAAFEKAVDAMAEAMRREFTGLVFLMLLDEDAATHKAEDMASLLKSEREANDRIATWRTRARERLSNTEDVMRRECARL